MKFRLFIVFLIVLTACNTRSGDKNVNKLNPNSSTTKKTILGQKTVIFLSDTVLINGHWFIQVFKNDIFNCLLTLKGDTIVESEDFYHEIKILDIDEDGYKDIRAFIQSNTPNQCDNYLFDKTLKIFRKVENSDLDIVKIKNTKYFYSYNHAGCADLTWESHLSKIENYKEINIGLILVNSCGAKNNRIEIFKIDNGTDKKIFRTFPIIKFDNNGANNKWAYLKHYWTQNYAAFE